MANIKSASDIAKKWSRVTPQRSEDYEAGVKNPRVDWASATRAAEESYKKGVMEAASKGRFGKGVSEAGTEKWQGKVISKGVDRWGTGVQTATSDYEEGFGPYADVIKSVNLPPRYPKGDPRNIERVTAIAKALRSKKVGA
jgi:hypothetical protein